MTPEWLHAPLQLTDKLVLENQCYLIAPDFVGKSWEAVLFGNQVKDVTIRNVTLIGAQGAWQERWDQPGDTPATGPGIDGNLSGIKIQGGKNVRIEHCRIEGFPRFGLYLHGIQDSLFRELQIRRCFQGMRFGNVEPNPRNRIERVHTQNTWGPGPGLWPGIAGWPSELRPGQFIGSDAIVGERLSDSLLLDCSATGEMFTGFKFASGCRGLELVRLRTNCLQLDGGTGESEGAEVLAIECEIDKRLCFSQVSQQGQALQISHRSQIWLERCRILGGSGLGGHGVQVYGTGANASLIDCTLGGFNGLAGSAPAYALQTVAGGVVNPDFLERNGFENQQRLWLKS